MPAAFNVDGFTSTISKLGLANPNKFKVEITFPEALKQSIETLRELSIMCETVSVSGRGVQTILDLQYGLRKEIAYNAPVYQPITLSFLCSSELKEKQMLDNWNNFIVPNNKGQGFDVAYYDDYKGTLKVTMLDNDGITPKYAQVYEEAYPKTINAIELNHTTQNSVARVTADFQYAYWNPISNPK
tara:strand:- start:33 stop:590 length:558 start_codon:yes stop_codon:yes gene_type:complete